MTPSATPENYTTLTDVTEDFLEAVKAAFPEIDWEKTYKEFRAAGEKEG
jgi:hypothetical protein